VNSQHAPLNADCEAIQDLITEYAFGLTDTQETHLVEVGLRRCPEAAEQLAEFQRMQAEMRASVAQIEPSPGFGARLMAAIAPPIIASAPRRLHPAWLVAAAAIIVLVFTNAYWLVQTRNATLPSTEAAEPVGIQGNTTLVLNPANALRWVHLPPAEQSSGANAVLMWNTQSAIGLLYCTGFPMLDAGKTYQLWLTDSSEHISIGTFQVDQEGKAAMLFHIPDVINEYTWARVTAEPGSGGQSPDGTVVVVGKLS